MKLTSDKENVRIAIIGAGSWGTAVAMNLSINKHDVIMWTHETDVVTDINENHKNTDYLPGNDLSHYISATSNPDDLKDCDLFVLAVPTKFIREVMTKHNFPINGKLIVNLSKGIENKTLMRISEILRDTIGMHLEQYVILAGPSHAEEVAKNMPTTVVAASLIYENSQFIQKVFSTPSFRVYSSEDVTGCEIGGAVKNVIALAAGVLDGLGLGDNTKAALMTRGLAEMLRLGVLLGANPLTFSGLSGLGDLIATCSSQHSRNRYVGEQIGKGKSLKEILSDMKMIAEGVNSAESIYHLFKSIDADMPIIERMYAVLFEDQDPKAAITDLMTRKYQREIRKFR